MNTNTTKHWSIGRLAPAPRYSRYAAVPADRDAQRLGADLAALPVVGAEPVARRSVWAAVRGVGRPRVGQAHGPGGRSAPRAA